MCWQWNFWRSTVVYNNKIGMPYYIDIVHQNEYTEIVAIWEASVRATHHFLKEADIQYFKPLIYNEYLHAVNLFCVRNEDNKMVGFLGVAGGKIEMLFVHPTAMGKGAGTKLAKYAIEKLKATKVDVNEDNPKAVGFYQHLGFKTISRSALDSLGKPFPILHMAL